VSKTNQKICEALTSLSKGNLNANNNESVEAISKLAPQEFFKNHEQYE
jgi:hypothetical protein